MKTKVVLLGAGYASVWSYRALRRHLGSKVDITVVAPYETHIYHGFTGEVLSGDMRADLQQSPLNEVFPKANRLLGQATSVDASAKTVTVQVADGLVVLDYDHLVVATGAVENDQLVPGLGEFGHPLRSPGMPEKLLRRFDANLQAAANIAPSAAREQLRTTVVIGAGFAGTEVAAALSRRVQHSGVDGRVVLVSSSDVAVPTWSQRQWLTSKIKQNLDRDGVELISGKRASQVSTLGVTLEDGTFISAATVVTTVGNRALPLEGLQDFQGARGQLVVDGLLQVTAGIWSAGDVALVPRASGGYAPDDALWAIREGTRVGRNIAHQVKGRKAKVFNYRGLGCVASFRTGHAVARLYGVPLAGVAAWVLRCGFFLWFIPSRPHALRVLGAALTGRAGQPVQIIRDSIASIPRQRGNKLRSRHRV